VRPVLTLPALPSLCLSKIPARQQLPCQKASLLISSYLFFVKIYRFFTISHFHRSQGSRLPVLGALSGYSFPRPRVKGPRSTRGGIPGRNRNSTPQSAAERDWTGQPESRKRFRTAERRKARLDSQNRESDSEPRRCAERTFASGGYPTRFRATVSIENTRFPRKFFQVLQRNSTVCRITTFRLPGSLKSLDRMYRIGKG